MKYINYVEYLKEHRTDAEQVYLNYLKKNKIEFEFQKPIKTNGKNYILDFYLPQSKIAVEIDGGYHTQKNQKKRDKKRDKNLESIGIFTIRYTNEEILTKFK